MTDCTLHRPASVSCSSSQPVQSWDPLSLALLYTTVVIVGVRRIERVALVARYWLGPYHISTDGVQSPLVTLRRRQQAHAWIVPVGDIAPDANEADSVSTRFTLSLDVLVGSETSPHATPILDNSVTASEKSYNTLRYDLSRGSQFGKGSSLES